MLAELTVTSVGKAPAAIELVGIVSVPNLFVGIVPDVNCDAFKFVKFSPLIAGKTVGNLLFGKVPDVKLVAF